MRRPGANLLFLHGRSAKVAPGLRWLSRACGPTAKGEGGTSLRIWDSGLGRGLRAATLAVSAASVVAGPSRAEQVITDRKDPFIPAIWIDPDGCQHWVMDDGWRGYMDIRQTRDGKPVCSTKVACAAVPADALFASGSATVTENARRRLVEFFRRSSVGSFAVAGYTDSDGSASSNLSLSTARAQAVAGIAQEAGAKVTSVKGYGEARPAQSNATESGKAHNRRVEIFCSR